ncbi:MAG TPA: hypothetical protein VKG85_08465 [Actinomycetes bacterium]|nr:hypothetical protein [Actinomycetes bacterium]
MAILGAADKLVSPLRWTKPSSQQADLQSLRDAVMEDAAARLGADETTEQPTISDLTELWVASPAAMRQLEDSYLTCQRFLSAADRPQGRERILAPIRAALDVQRCQGADAADRDQAMSRILDDGQEHAAQYVSERAERNARRLYAQGLVHGAVVSVALVVLLGLLAIGIAGVVGMVSGDGWASFERDGYWALRDALACMAGGVTGASLSVLLRLSQIEQLDYRTIDKSAALYRLAVGWLFAAALLVLIKGGILAAVFVDPTAHVIDGTNVSLGERVASFFWWIGIGLIAGFNERWARNLLSRDPTDADRAKTPIAPASPTTGVGQPAPAIGQTMTEASSGQ